MHPFSQCENELVFWPYTWTKQGKPDQTLRQILPPTQNLSESSEAPVILLHVCLETCSRCQDLGCFSAEEANKPSFRSGIMKPYFGNCWEISIEIRGDSGAETPAPRVVPGWLGNAVKEVKSLCRYNTKCSWIHYSRGSPLIFTFKNPSSVNPLVSEGDLMREVKCKTF